MECKFNDGWGGCHNKANHSGYCYEHRDLKCKICGAQATHYCTKFVQCFGGEWMCGVPLCDNPACIEEHNKFHNKEKK